MATAKIATLAIRTLAKPIATQLKSQAAQHETFRNICISLAQRMHRTEMALRANLLPQGATQKVRPLNDAKAIANGANAISEGFLFFVAATLILGETYRGSRKKAEQRDRTEEEVARLRELLDRFAERVGVDIEEVEREIDATSSEGEAKTGEDGSDGRGVDQDGTPVPLLSSYPSQVGGGRHGIASAQDEEAKIQQLQKAVEVLLKLALKNQWIAGDEALQLDGIVRGRESSSDAHRAGSSSQVVSTSISSSGQTTDSAPSPPPPPPPPAPPASSQSEQDTIASPSIIQQVALERARALAREVRGEPALASVGGAQSGGGGGDLSELYELLERVNRQPQSNGDVGGPPPSTT